MDSDDVKDPADGESWARLEEKYLQLGKTYGYSGEELRTYVENRLTKDEERLERAQSRTRTAQQKTESDVLGQVEELRVKLRELSDGSSVSAGSSFMKSFDSQEQRPPRIPVPKYENKQDVRRYLDVFESLMSANGYAEKDWLLALRSAVMGTKLETTLEGLDHYEEAKKEILLEHGQSVDKVWKELVSVRQGDESFHRYTSRVVKQLIQWLSLGGIKADVISSPDSTAGKICLLLAKQLIMDGVSEELKAYLKERKVAELSYEEFQAVGSSYQEAHGRPTAKAAAKPASSTSSASVASTSLFAVGAEDVKAKLKAISSVKDRKDYCMKNNLCFCCLGAGHRVFKCKSKERCTTCNKKHNTLLHSTEPASAPVTIRSQSVRYSSSPTYLMTAAAKICAQKDKVARIFFDQGSQATFVSRALVEDVKPCCVGNAPLS